MKIIIGLGNPEKKLFKSRHNIGFTILELLQKEFSSNFSNFKLEKKLQAEISFGEINKEKILLIKTQGYYNNSGQDLKNVLSYYKESINNIIVIHDDLDIPIGKIRIAKNANSAGNNGVQSIIDNFKTKDFIRLRIGISNETKNKKNASDFVLEKFSLKDKKILKEVIPNSLHAIIDLIEDFPDITKTQNLYN